MLISKLVRWAVLFGIAASCVPAWASPVSPNRLQIEIEQATKGLPVEVAQCIASAIRYVWDGSKYEQLRWEKDDSDFSHVKQYYHDGSQVTEVSLLAYGHVRDWKISDTLERVRVNCMEIDHRIYRVEIRSNP